MKTKRVIALAALFTCVLGMTACTGDPQPQTTQGSQRNGTIIRNVEKSRSIPVNSEVTPVQP